jgi:TPR repeat protein
MRFSKSAKRLPPDSYAASLLAGAVLPRMLDRALSEFLAHHPDVAAELEELVAKTQRSLERAAAAGDIKAMTELAQLLGVRDPAAARRWWERAAAAGDTRAMTRLVELEYRDPAAPRYWPKPVPGVAAPSTG